LSAQQTDDAFDESKVDGYGKLSRPEKDLTTVADIRSVKSRSDKLG
jgi:hypothetical protein